MPWCLRKIYLNKKTITGPKAHFHKLCKRHIFVPFASSYQVVSFPCMYPLEFPTRQFTDTCKQACNSQTPGNLPVHKSEAEEHVATWGGGGGKIKLATWDYGLVL